MTRADCLRHWGLVLRDLCERNELREAVVTLEDGTRLVYEPSVGLSVESADGGTVFPNEWLDSERWAAVA